MKASLSFSIAVLMATAGCAQTTWQVCVAEVISAGSCSGGTAVFTPATLNIQQGDVIQFTTRMELISGYDGTNHDIQFAGSPANNVLLPISTNILNRWTTVTTAPFNSTGTFSMECVDGNHCIYAQNLNGWSCNGYSVTVVPSSACPVTSGFTASDTAVCAGTNIVFTNTSTGASSYQWYLDGSPVDTTTNVSMVFSSPGTYSVSLASSDTNCTDSVTQDITVFANPGVLSDNATGVQCYGACDGTASVVIGGGALPYAYGWSSGCNLPICTNLCAGSYFVTVTDANGCIVTDSVVVSEPGPLVDSIVSVNLQCNGVCDGSIDNFPSGGTSPYAYLWCSGEIASGIDSLCAGIYCLVITDAAGCTLTPSITVTEPSALGVSLGSIGPLTVGGCDGTLNDSVSGGTPPYTYQWDAAAGSQVTASATGLCAGYYCLTITDTNACAVTACDTVSDPACNMVVSDSSMAASCAGTCDGSITAIVSGASPPISYLWDNGDTSATVSGLCKGLYSVTASDNIGCLIALDSIVIDEPVLLATTLTYATDSGCYYAATANVTGGTTPYTYQWDSLSGSQTTATATGLNANCCSYALVITDANGCQDSALADLVCSGIIQATKPLKLSIIPNPSRGDFVLEIEAKPEQVRIMTLSGREEFAVFDPSCNTLHAGTLPNGIYVIEVYADGQVVRTLVIKNGFR